MRHRPLLTVTIRTSVSRKCATDTPVTISVTSTPSFLHVFGPNEQSLSPRILLIYVHFGLSHLNFKIFTA